MKKLLLILLCLPMIGFAQQTYVPDDNFEQEYNILIDNEIKNDSTNKVLKKIKYYYNMLIQGTEDFNIESLSNSAGKIETNLQQYLINSPEKVQFHINKGKKYDIGSDIEIYDKEYQKRGYFPMPDGTGEID